MVARMLPQTSPACSAVAVLPVPVAPMSTTSFSPFSMRVASSSMAFGWSPEGLYGDLTTNGLFTRSMLNPMVPSRFLTPLFHQPINTVEHVFYILG